MNIKYEKEIGSKSYSGIVIPFFEDSKLDNIQVLSNEEMVDLEYLEGKELFKGEKNEVFQYSIPKGKEIQEVIYLGLGKEEDFDINILRKSVAKAFKLIKSKKIENIAFLFDNLGKVINDNYKFGRTLAEAIIMSDYTFDKYKTKEKKEYLEDVIIIYNELEELFIEGINEGICLGEVNIFSRKIVNDPANILTPESLAKVVSLEGEGNYEVEVLSLEKIKTLKMEAFLAVAKGSTEEPKLIIMRYKGNPGGETLGYIGKGLTYDAGGLSIKPTSGMIEMKSDMGGAAAVVGAMNAISKMKLKVNVTAVVAACENMISGTCYKPGDIIGSMAGKSIFIGNTDAEGRLTLVDAVNYAIEHEKVDSIIDIATLTGAAIHCLGVDITPILSNNDKIYSGLERASKECDEKIWRLPIIDEYKDLLKHDHADLTNSPGAPGTITAGLFIGEFIKDLPWLHLDIAGTSFLKKAKNYHSDGATGEGARLLYYLAKEEAKASIIK